MDEQPLLELPHVALQGDDRLNVHAVRQELLVVDQLAYGVK
jgi:hypothetical protein